ncbi:MAG TPA: methyltransferase domain-containing protein [Methanothrix sp.]|nr:methyltransferase domain-containing protein [Methanothrix sp.]HQE87308.1 methyltransferase domain-containing protein [Methanothrix sp.]HQI67686.1 methyltransferase domain-containing protein [Methanothrix sp.]HRS85194.1 methyltransferase domain-containing protein [Methanothrix sp.]HRT16838.1 methyltransferase domain-containing protein [Methanothrix sp.]
MSIKRDEYNFDFAFLKENMMGPNALRIFEEVSQSLNIEKGMRVLDLGCGKGLTSIFLAKNFDVTVFAADLWISATENYQRFKALGLEKRIIPIHAEAHDLPFAEEYFDMAVCIDAYHYFGAEPDYLGMHLAPLIRRGGEIAVAVPGLKKDFEAGVPPEMQPFWQENMNLYSCQWWEKLWRASDLTRTRECRELKCCREAWEDWLACDNYYARRDIDMMCSPEIISPAIRARTHNP